MMVTNESTGPDRDRHSQIPLPFNDTTQKGQILRLLRTGRPVCGAYLLSLWIPRYSAAIYELRQEGWPIRTEHCEDPAHQHRARIAAYRLEVADD